MIPANLFFKRLKEIYSKGLKIIKRAELVHFCLMFAIH